MRGLLFLANVIFFSSAYASQVIENFTTTTYRDPATTGVWNSYFKYAHPPLANDFNSVNNVDEEQLPVTDAGDGSDGPFDTFTYANFSVGGSTAGNIITIDTNAHPALQLTYFYLAPGWTIQGTGANPLWFKVLGTFYNAGTIDCSGGAGSPSNSSVGISPSGGTGRCGGGAGGSGGYSGSPTGATGGSGCTVPACTITGGAGGGTAANNSGGGGGGGGYYSATSGSNAVGGAGPGAGGVSQSDPTMLKFGTLAGGPGGGSGGGGAGYDTTTNASSGAGGGGGGGAIKITAVGDFTNVATGSILAGGGNGGAESATDHAGAGGGGAGGSIWIQTTGSFTNAGPINALGGAAGAIGGGGLGAGGAGASGRTWLLYGGSNTFTMSENPTTLNVNGGEMHYSDNSFIIQSKPYDVRNTKPTYTSFTMNALLPGASVATLQVAGSSDGFVSDDTGFVAATNVTALAGKRYFRFKITATHTPVGGFVHPVIPAPVEIYSVTATFDGVKQTQFNFSPACGKLDGPGEFLFLISLFGFVRILTKKLQSINRRPHQPKNLYS